MTGNDIIKFIKNNQLEEAPVSVTATQYSDGDHSCRTTYDVSVNIGYKYLGKGKSTQAVEFYVDDNLY